MTDHSDCNCEQAQGLQSIVEALEAQYLKLDGERLKLKEQVASLRQELKASSDRFAVVTGELVEQARLREQFQRSYHGMVEQLRGARARLEKERASRRSVMREKDAAVKRVLEDHSVRLLEVEKLPRLSALDVVKTLGDSLPPWVKPSTKWLVDARSVMRVLCERPAATPAPPWGMSTRTVTEDRMGPGGSYPDW